MKSKRGRKRASTIAQQLELLNYSWDTSIEEIISQEDPSIFYARRILPTGWPMQSETDYKLMSGGEDTPETPDSYYITPEELEGFWGSRANHRGIR